MPEQAHIGHMLKRVFCRERKKQAVYSAVSHYNDGLFQHLEVEPGYFTLAACQKHDNVRIRKSETKSSEPAKKRQKL